jgi:rsbT co-antagonist protein RsbR
METRQAAEERSENERADTHRVPFPVVGFDLALQITTWNERAVEHLGFTQVDALGRNVAELIPVTGGEASWRGLLVDRDDAAPVCLAHANGRTWEWSPATSRDRQGRRVGVVCYGSDVTERLVAQRESQLEHVMLRVMIDNLPVVLCAYDPEGVYLAVEGKGLAGVGVMPGQLVGQSPFVVFGENAGAVEFVRRGLAGIPTEMDVEEFGHFWQSWHVPAPPGSRAALVSVSLDITEAKRREQQLLETIGQIERQQEVIRDLSSPIIEVWDGILALPILGLVDSVRTAEIMDRLLQGVSRMRARFAILDMTGVEVMDTATANHLIVMIRALRLLGAEGVITGIHPGIAQTIVTLGVDLRGISVHATLRQALKYCIATTSPAAE